MARSRIFFGNPPAGPLALDSLCTSSLVQLSNDNLTAEYIGPSQFLVPDGDFQKFAWTTQSDGTTNLYQSIDETVSDDSDYAQSPFKSGTTSYLVVQLLQGSSTTVAYWVHLSVSEEWTTVTHTLNSTDYAKITDFTDLRIQLDAQGDDFYILNLTSPAATPAAGPVTISYRYKKIVSGGTSRTIVSWVQVSCRGPATTYATSLSHNAKGTKLYAEALLQGEPVAGLSGFGFTLSNVGFENNWIGSGGTDSLGLYSDGLIYRTGSSIATGFTVAAGQTIAIAVDISTATKTVSFRNVTTDSAWTTPQTVSGGLGQNRLGFSASKIGAKATVNFDGAFLGEAPTSDYTRWDGSAISATQDFRIGVSWFKLSYIGSEEIVDVTGPLVAIEADDTANFTGEIKTSGALAVVEAADVATIRGKAAFPATGLTLDPFLTSDKFALSNGDLTATRTSTSGAPGSSLSVLSVAGPAKLYAEAICDVSRGTDQMTMGICNSAFNYESSWIGADNNSLGWWAGGWIFKSSQIGTGPTYTDGHRIAVMVDTDTRAVAFRNITTDSAWTSSFAFSGTSGQPLHFGVSGYSSGNKASFVFDDTMLGPVPSGYTKWDGTAFAPPATGTLVAIEGTDVAALDGSVTSGPIISGGLVIAEGSDVATFTGDVLSVSYLRPDGDIVLNGWTDHAGGASNIYQAIDESSVNDADFIQSPPASTPDLFVRLFEGSTEIAEWIHTDISDTLTTAEQTLTAPQIAAISNFSNLFAEFDDNSGNVYRCRFSDPPAGAVAPIVLRYRYGKVGEETEPENFVFLASTTTRYTSAHSGATSAAIDTTGANLIVVVLSGQDTPSVVTDNQGNIYASITKTGATPFCVIRYKVNPVTNASHTFTITGFGAYGAITVLAFSGPTAIPVEEDVGATGSSMTASAASLTPSNPNCLVIAGVSHLNDVGADGITSINGGFSTPVQVRVHSGQCYGVGASYLVQGVAAAADPDWALVTPGGLWAASVVAFRPAPAITTFNPLDLFAGGEKGFFLDFSQTETLFQDSAGTTAVTADGQPIGRIEDLSPNGVNFLQATSGSRPTYQVVGGLRFGEAFGAQTLKATGVNMGSSQAVTVCMGFQKYQSEIGTQAHYEIGPDGVTNGNPSLRCLQSYDPANPKTWVQSTGGSGNSLSQNVNPLLFGEASVMVPMVWTNRHFLDGVPNRHRQNGVDLTATAYTETNYNNYGGSHSAVLYAMGGDGLLNTFMLASIVAINRDITPAEETALEAWMAAKCGAVI